MSSAAFTVHGITESPSPRASRTSAGVRLRNPAAQMVPAAPDCRPGRCRDRRRHRAAVPRRVGPAPPQPGRQRGLRAGDVGTPDPRRHPPRMMQRAPVERAQHHLARHAHRGHHSQHRIHHPLRCRGQLRPIRQGLDLDIHHKSRRPRQRQHIGQCRDPRPIARRLAGELRSIGAARPQPSDIIAMQRRPAEIAHQRPRRPEPAPIRRAHDVAVQHRVMHHHRHAIGGQRDIELHRVDPQRECHAKPLQRVLRPQPARAAMPRNVKSTCHDALPPPHSFATSPRCGTVAP